MPKSKKNDFSSMAINQEEYVWAMRVSAYEFHRQKNEDQDSDTSVPSKEIDAQNEETNKKQAQTLASFVPDEVLFNVNDYSIKSYDVCILCSQISGFSHLFEMNTAMRNTKITDALNYCIGSMVQEVLSHGGDVLKFSDNGFLATWKCTGDSFVRDYIHQVINCCLVIQKSFGTFVTDLGVVKAKFSIAAGGVLFSLLGDSNLANYIMVGQPVLDVRATERICEPGEILLSTSAWQYTDKNSYLIEEMDNGNYIKILGVGPNWRQVQKYTKALVIGIPTTTIRSESSSSSETSVAIQFETDFLLRPTVNNVFKYDLMEHMKKFFIKPVMDTIELYEPLEFLSEMRQVSITAINVVPMKMPFELVIRVMNSVFQIIVGHVVKYDGCLNKFTRSEKSYVILLIFGLRGLKHTMESLRALNCAAKCYKDINTLSSVNSVSVAVTTGKAYCGVFGHTLRREYTVIGSTVNKALAMIDDYPGKVTCCNHTYINSKMKYMYFKQQHYAPGAGPSQIGPVYEFLKDTFISHTATMDIKYPILGREPELNLYLELVRKFADNCKPAPGSTSPPKSVYKMLLVSGDAKIGKSRFFDECIYLTPSDIKVSRIIIHAGNKERFQIIREIFYSALGFTMNTPTNVKQPRIANLMKDNHNKGLCWVFNEIFDLNFEVGKKYRSLSHIKLKAYQNKMIKELAYRVFKTPRVIAIDRSNIIDAEIWAFFPTLITVRAIFFLITIRSQKKMNEMQMPIFNNPLVKAVKLKRIDKLYLAALACQILNVRAIPADLEKLIQTRSNGCPGWIENYLHCLLQAGIICVHGTVGSKRHDHSLVLPPLYMMLRMDSAKLEMWKNVMEEKQLQTDKEQRDETLDPWHIYIDSCRDSHTNINVRENLDEMMGIRRDINVCTLCDKYELRNFRIEAEFSKDVLIMKLFDSLSYYEQLTVKCSSVLGLTFPRHMLEYVLNMNSKRQLAEAVKKLFEIKILTCAQGDFSEGNYVLVRDKIGISEEHHPVECRCFGLDVPDSCSDLPKYASCGFMCFISSPFYSTTYNLLPEQQKKEFHIRAARYLEKNTRKCRACGNGIFIEDTGLSFQKKWKRGKKISSAPENYQIESIYSGSYSEQDSHGTRDHHSASEVMSIFEQDVSYGFSMGMIGRKTIYRLKESFSLTRTFSLYDFSNCECNLILNAMYEKIIQHYRGSDCWREMLTAMLKYAKSCISLSNTSAAIIVLNDTQKHIDTHGLGPNEPSWKQSIFEGNIHAILAKALIVDELFAEALGHLYIAMEKFGTPFPKSNLSRYIKRQSLLLQQKLALYMFPDTLPGKLKQFEAEYYTDVANCLTTFCEIFEAENKWNEFELAACWSLKLALKAEYDFRIICYSFSNMITVAQVKKNNFHCIALEIHALRYCHKKLGTMDMDELKAIAVMYYKIRQSRLVRSELEKCIYLGYIVLRMSVAVKYLKLIFQIMPSLIISLVFKMYLQEAASLINELDYYSNESDNTEGKAYFYSSCLIFHLETGYTVVPYRICEKFYYSEGTDMPKLKNADARRRFVTTMWLWNLRNGRWEAASQWTDELYSFMKYETYSAIRITFTSMYIAEGYLLSLVRAKNCLNIKMMQELDVIVQKILKILGVAAKFGKISAPRYKHFKAYYEHIKGDEQKASEFLESGIIDAEKYENTLELVFINHSKKAWDKTLSASARNFWVLHCDPDHIIDFHHMDLYDHKIGCFTLPTPKYEN